MELDKISTDAATATYKCEAEHPQWTCKVRVTKEGIRITARWGLDVDVVGCPGAKMVLFRRADSFEEAMNVAKALPELPPEAMKQHGFTITDHVMYN